MLLSLLGPEEVNIEQGKDVSSYNVRIPILRPQTNKSDHYYRHCKCCWCFLARGRNQKKIRAMFQVKTQQSNNDHNHQSKTGIDLFVTRSQKDAVSACMVEI